ncbi:SDR family NAD(P)-dependent oxidoreductase [Jiangella anatolica]|uniref:NAD(P)-dependent oxidoreductase n=1 Tax=Jiangella anatolica TaxID=2670374 RepID=A0A2W2C185_9ACTN|nr:SDR family oxidoreductase [Jiangella anatolica]PZF79536.1 NAD(P)-dependent oxidoreductase [Jiangella anatolica]
MRAVVTGAANGIGLAVAGRLRADGATVVGLDVEPGVDVVEADLADDTARARAAREALGRLGGGVDVLVNVAGIFRTGSVGEGTVADWRALWAVNLEAPMALMATFVPVMAAAGFGRVVNVTSVHAAFAQPASIAYDVGKAGLEAATRSVALDYAAHGVLANAVAPGFVRTRMSVLPDGVDETDTPQFRAGYVESGKLPLGRAAQPAEVAEVVSWLAGRANTYVTGQVVTVDGGLTATF